jgi:hypothetical protein
MAHYAFLNQNGIVIEVIYGKEEDEKENGETVDWEKRYEEIRGLRCKRTSYNTRAGVHTAGGTPFRKNYAGIGHFYNNRRDAFIPPQPYPSWTLNEETCLWDAPKPPPEDVGTGIPPKMYDWDEFTQEWFDVTPTEYTPPTEFPMPPSASSSE